MKARDRAGEEANEVDKQKFSYALVGGRRPRSREAGIVMLADAVEATSTALRPDSEKAIEKLVNSIVDSDLIEGQLDESELTLGDIKLIRASFIETLKGRYHVRVRYPGDEEFEIEPHLAAAEQANGAISQLPAIEPPAPAELAEDRPT
jgi:membrane-associated HD superfamily phosphohydrolase